MKEIVFRMQLVELGGLGESEAVFAPLKGNANCIRLRLPQDDVVAMGKSLYSNFEFTARLVE